MNSKLILILLTFNLTFGLLQKCGQSEGENRIEHLTNNVWTSEVIRNSCLDTLKFNKDLTLNYYSCEIDWEYYGIYKVTGDTLEIGINMAQFEVENYDPKEVTAKWTLKIKQSELEWLKIEHLNGTKFNEVEQNVYEQLNNFKK